MKNLKLSLGLIAKYNADNSKFNWGLGSSLELGYFTVGASKYKDDYYIKDETVTPAYEYFERYNVETFTVGIKLPHIIADFTYLNDVFNYYGQRYDNTISLLTTTVF